MKLLSNPGLHIVSDEKPSDTESLLVFIVLRTGYLLPPASRALFWKHKQCMCSTCVNGLGRTPRAIFCHASDAVVNGNQCTPQAPAGRQHIAQGVSPVYKAADVRTNLLMGRHFVLFTTIGAWLNG